LFKNRTTEIYNTLDNFKANHKSFFLTSSFQTQSLVLLKIVSDYDSAIPVYFINTNYHFPETIKYKNSLELKLNLNIIEIFSDTTLLNQLNCNNRLLYTSDTDQCCEINKIRPLQNILNSYDIWITGIRKDQTAFRQNSDIIEKLDNNKIKYNPVLNWTDKDVNKFIKHYQLPRHPLDKTGNMSIGCQPCTRFLNDQKRANGRWFGQTKTECGLHLNFKEQG